MIGLIGHSLPNRPCQVRPIWLGQVVPSPYNNKNNKKLYNNKNKNKKKYPKISMSPFKIFFIFSHVFPIILHNIGLYIYTIRYKSSIKIPGFKKQILNFFFENSKNFKLIFYLKKQKKHVLFSCTRPNPKRFFMHIF